MDEDLRLKVPNTLVDDKTIDYRAMIPALYLLMIYNKKLNSYVADLPSIDYSMKDEEWYDPPKIKDYKNLRTGLNNLALNDYCIAEPDYFNKTDLYRITPKEKLIGKDIEDYSTSFLVDIDKVKQIYSSEKRYHYPVSRVLRNYMWLCRNAFKAPHLPSHFKHQFYLGSEDEFGNYISNRKTRSKVDCIDISRIGREWTEFMIRENLITRIDLDPFIRWPGRRKPVTHFYALCFDADLIQLFINYLYENQEVVVPEKPKEKIKRKPVPKFRFEDELYNGYPAKFLYEYRGMDERMRELRRKMIEDWTE